MALVVRCTGCRGTSGIDDSERGLTVQCPHCEAQFVALPEAETVQSKRPKRNPTASTRRRKNLEPAESLPPSRTDSPASEADHDPLRLPTGGLPPSVLIGLALLPFAIPIFWILIPALIGPGPLLSIAVPLAIAVSTSILCLAIIYTIDWSPSIRIKGVLMLLGLAAFASISLYFLTQHDVQLIKHFFGHEDWHDFQAPHDPVYTTSLPGKAQREERQQPIPLVPLECYSVVFEKDPGDKYLFVVGSGRLQPKKGAKGPQQGSPRWFEQLIDGIVAQSGGQLDPEQKIKTVTAEISSKEHADGREFAIKLPDQKTSRVVRVFLDQENLFYQSVEGVELPPEEDGIWTFFKDFKIRGSHGHRR